MLIVCHQVVIKKHIPRRAAKAFWDNVKEENKKGCAPSEIYRAVQLDEQRRNLVVFIPK